LTQWLGPAFQGYQTVAATGATIIASAAFESPLTIVRTRGMISVRPTTTAATIDMVGAIGMGIVTAEAFAAGVASVPEPHTDADWGGWFVWRSFGFAIDVTTDISRIKNSIEFEIDSKAMRKVTANEVLVVVCFSLSQFV